MVIQLLCLSPHPFHLSQLLTSTPSPNHVNRREALPLCPPVLYDPHRPCIWLHPSWVFSWPHLFLPILPTAQGTRYLWFKDWTLVSIQPSSRSDAGIISLSLSLTPPRQITTHHPASSTSHLCPLPVLLQSGFHPRCTSRTQKVATGLLIVIVCARVCTLGRSCVRCVCERCPPLLWLCGTCPPPGCFRPCGAPLPTGHGPAPSSPALLRGPSLRHTPLS